MSEKLETIGRIIRDFGLSSLESRLSILDNIHQNSQHLDVAVLGQFKAGKSSLLNSLIRKALLTAGVIPVTSVITTISSGEKDIIRVVDEQGGIINCPPEEIELYITEKFNPGNEKKIARIEIQTPMPAGYEELRFTDTPGLGSIYRSSSETTINWIPQSAVALVMISSIQPASDADIQLIKETLSHSPFLVIVISKTDLLPKASLTESINFTKDVLAREFGRPFPVIEYSIKKDEDLHRKRLLDEVLRPMLLEKEKLTADLRHHKLNSLIRDAAGYLEIALAASRKEVSKRQEIRDYILDERTQEEFIRKDLSMIAASYSGQSRKIIEEEILQKNKEDISGKLEIEYRNKFGSWNGNIRNRTVKYEDWIKEALADAIREVSRRENIRIEAHLAGATDHFSHYQKSFRESLNGKIKEVFGLSLPWQEWDIQVPIVEQPDIFVRPAFDIHIDMLGPLFPMWLLKGWLKRFFQKQISDEAEKNLSRLVTDLTANVNLGIEHLKKQTYDYINTEISTVEKLLAESSDNSEEIASGIEVLKGLNND